MIAQLMEQCATLQELQLQNNEIDNTGGTALVNQIKKRKIAKLDCDNNHLTGQILADLLQMTPIQKLHLVKSTLSDAQVQPMANSLIKMRDLKQVYMSHNNLSNNALGMLADALAVNVKIEEISMTHNDLSLPNGVKVIRALKNMTGLKKLSLNSCTLDQELL